MSEDLDLLPDRERARARSRDRKVRGPRVVLDNPGLKTLTLALAEKRRAARAAARRSERKERRAHAGEGER